MMVLRLLYNPDIDGLPMKVGCFMSGSGTNVTKIIENELSYLKRGESCPYHVELIFSDIREDRVDREGRKICFAKEISESYKIPYVCNDIRDFYRSKGHKTIRDLSLRPEFDTITLEKIRKYDLRSLALGGYMSIITRPLLETFPDRIVNVHPADLSILENGRRKYIGTHAVRDAILAGEKNIYSSTFIVRPSPQRQDVDAGEILMRSPAVPVWLLTGTNASDLTKPGKESLLEEVIKRNQENLKEHGDWVVFPKTLEIIATGRYGIDENRNIYVDGKQVPNGFRL